MLFINLFIIFRELRFNCINLIFFVEFIFLFMLFNDLWKKERKKNNDKGIVLYKYFYKYDINDNDCISIKVI